MECYRKVEKGRHPPLGQKGIIRGFTPTSPSGKSGGGTRAGVVIRSQRTSGIVGSKDQKHTENESPSHEKGTET